METLKMPALTGALSVLFLALLNVLTAGAGEEEGLLQVAFLDVGQGDATFIESPSGTQVLIDGGRDGSILRELGREMGFFDRTIDLVVATHPDLDHIGGLVDVLLRYEVKTILTTENTSDTPAFEAFLAGVEAERATVIYARRGQMFDLGAGPDGTTTLRILFPDRDPTNWESNTASVVAQLVYGETEVLLTGDAPDSVEGYLVSLSDSTLESDVLKVGHHGSRTSTSELFLNAVGPLHAVISAGKDNSYGHPHEEVVELLKESGVAQKNTADEGSIFLLSDGGSYWFR